MTWAKWPWRETGLWCLRLVLSGVFIYAGVTKIREPQAFAESVASFRLLPNFLIDPAALTLPPLEVLGGILALCGRRWRRAGSFCLLILSAMFLLALVSAQARGLHVDCGCFGASHLELLSSGKTLWVAIGRDLVLGGAAWVLYRRTLHPLPATISGS